MKEYRIDYFFTYSFRISGGTLCEMIGDALSDGALLVPPADADGRAGEKLRSLSGKGVSITPDTFESDGMGMETDDG